MTVEREAGFAKRRGKAFFGFKAHPAVDRGSGLVRRARLTPANIHASLVADGLIVGDEAAVFADEAAVFADEAYGTAARHAELAARGIADGVMRRGQRNRPLTPEETARNRALAPIRAAVERAFGTSKRSHRWARVRHRGLARNAAHLDLLRLAMNLRRADALTA